MGFILAIITTLCWSIGIFPFTESAKRLGVAATNQWRLLLAWLIITGVACVLLHVSLLDLFVLPKPAHYIYLGLSGFIGFSLGDYFGIYSFAALGPRKGSVLTTLAPIAALLTGLVFLDDKVSYVSVIGILITLGAVSWLILGKKDENTIEQFNHTNAEKWKGITFGLLGAICQGVGLVLSKKAMNYYGAGSLPPIHAVWIRLMFAWLSLFVISIFTKKLSQNWQALKNNNQNGIKYMVLGTFMGPVLGVTFSLYTVNLISPSIAQTIFATLPICILPINYFVYKEKITISSILASVVAITGVIIMMQGM